MKTKYYLKSIEERKIEFSLILRIRLSIIRHLEKWSKEETNKQLMWSLIEMRGSYLSELNYTANNRGFKFDTIKWGSDNIPDIELLK